MTDSNQILDDCGCCEGIRVLTPASPQNPPGQSALVYRVGTHGTFKEAMKAGLARQQALERLTTRDDDDPSIALLDAWAAVLDVLTFYQERIANEGYLRVATERVSLLELARSIGYEFRPGVAASTYLAFELETAPPSPSVVTIDIGTQAQSLPGPNETPQIFETIEKLEARSEWNALKPQLKKPQVLGKKITQVYLKGVATQLQPGDAILIVGDEREKTPTNQQWFFRVLNTVTPHPDQGYTIVTFKKPLGPAEPPAVPQVFALRQRASLFGHNAPEPGSFIIPKDGKPPAGVDPDGLYWKNFKIQHNQIDLDATYPKIVGGGWLVLVQTERRFRVALCRVKAVSNPSRANFMLTGTITRVLPDLTVNPKVFELRDTAVYAQSEPLALDTVPVREPVQGKAINLDQRVLTLQKDQTLIFSGKRIRARLASKHPLPLVSADHSSAFLLADELVQVLEPPAPTSGGSLRWHFLTRDGFDGFAVAFRHQIAFMPAEKEDPLVSEVVSISEVHSTAQDCTTIQLTDALKNIYDRSTVTIYANVAQATHGETKHEVLGNGDASQAFQKFALKQTPLTYVSSSSPSGAATTLAVRVNNVLWDEATSLYGLGPRDRDYITRRADEGKVTVGFGDGITGMRPPTGSENVTAVYRVGIGTAGLVKAGQLSLLMSRPLGVKSVTNPLPAIGAADPENRDEARQNAPLTVLTFERIVSLQDFQDFARAFAGIAKAQAIWLWDGETRLVHLTVAGTKGAVVDPHSTLYKNLKQAIRSSSDPLQHFRIEAYQPLTFDVSARVLVDRRYLADAVLPALSDTLKQTFSFEQRDFGQPVTPSQVLALMQGVEGVTAVELEALYLTGQSKTVNASLLAHTARLDQGQFKLAELLTIHPSGITLTEIKP